MVRHLFLSFPRSEAVKECANTLQVGAKYSRPTNSKEMTLLWMVGREYLAHPTILSQSLRVLALDYGGA